MRRKKTLLGRLFIAITACVMLVSALTACDNSTIATTDKTMLQIAVTNAESVKAATDYSGYTQETRSAFEDALAAAKTINNNANATQAEIDNAKNNLVTAQNNLTTTIID